MPATIAEINKVLTDPSFTEGERQLLRWQFRMTGSFYTALFECIGKADRSNRARLAIAFPEEVAAYIAWADVPDLSDRFKAAGLDI